MSRIWRYVLANDNGMAPCPQGGVLSLACCKPQIRRAAQPGDWVIGFLPKNKGRDQGKVAWAGRVAEVLPLGGYQVRFPARFDAIYRKTAESWEGNEVLEPLRDDYHEDQRSRSRDLGGKNALVFDPFWYWGAAAVTAPEFVADLAHYYVGQSTTNSTPARVAALVSWLWSMGDPGIHGEPRDERRTIPMAVVEIGPNASARPRRRRC